MSKIYVKISARLADHNIVVVAVANTHHVRGHAIACARAHKKINGFGIIFLTSIVVANPVRKGAILISTKLSAVTMMDLGRGVGILDDLQHPTVVPGGNALVRPHV